MNPLAAIASLRKSHATQARLATSLFVVVAMFGFGGLFSSWLVLVPILFGCLGAFLVGEFAHSRSLLFGEALLLHALSFVAVGAVATQGLRISAFQRFAAALVDGWAALLSSPAPVDLVGSVATVPFAIAWGATLLGLTLHRFVKFPALPIIGPLVALASTTMFSVESRFVGVIQGAALVAGIVVISVLQRRAKAARNTTINAPAPATPRLLMGATVVALAAIGGPLMAPVLPLFDSNDRFDLRDVLENAWDPLDEPSPLATLKASIKEPRDEELVFTISGEEPITRMTLAVMGTYSGVVWEVADPGSSGPAQFIPVDTELPLTLERQRADEEDLEMTVGEQVQHTITVEDLGGHWVPHGGTPTRVEFADNETISDDGFGLRMNLSTGTLGVPRELVAGTTYTVNSLVAQPLSDQELLDAEFEADDRSVELAQLPQPVSNLAADVVQGEDFGGAQVIAIRDTLQGEGFYDKSDQTSPGHSYAEVTDFIDDRGRIIGYEEHYAASAGVMARVVQLPTRVTVGYLIEADRWEGGSAPVFAGDQSAWIEVLVEGQGWVPVDVTPDPSRRPTEEQLGRSSKNVAIPGDPPPPPPPPETDLLAQEELEEELEEEEDNTDEDDDAEDEAPGAMSLPLQVAVAAGSILLLLPLLFLLGVLLWKTVRRFRRRRAATPARRIAGAWEELVDQLEDSGFPTSDNLTASEVVTQYTDASEHTTDELEDELGQLARSVNASAYAPHAPTDGDADRAWEVADSARSRSLAGIGVLDRTKVRVTPRSLRLPKGPGRDG